MKADLYGIAEGKAMKLNIEPTYSTKRTLANLVQP